FHLDRRAELLARHELLDRREISFRAHGNCHDPVTHELVNEKLAVVVLREWSRGAAEIIAMKNRTCGRCTSTAADDRKLGRRRVGIPYEGAPRGREHIQSGV